MRALRPLVFIPLLFAAACSGENTPFPIDAKAVLGSLEGPKVPTIQETQMDAAANAEKQGNFAQATQIYQMMLEKSPNDTSLQLAYADSLRRGGDYDKSLAAYDEILRRDAANIHAREGKGLTLLSKGDYETPTPLFEEVMKVDSKRWKTLNALGILFVTRGLYPESQRYFSEALKYAPDNVSVMNNLGLSQALNKDFVTAIDTLQKASIVSENGSLNRKRIDLNLSLVYASAGKLDQAQRIAEMYLTGAALNNNLGLYAHLAKDDELAKSYLNMALTDSKTYYAKAWQNMETLETQKSQKPSGTAMPAGGNTLKLPESKPAPKTEVKKAKPAIKKANAPVAATATAVPVTPVTSTETQILGTLKGPINTPGAAPVAETPADDVPEMRILPPSSVNIPTIMTPPPAADPATSYVVPPAPAP